MNDLIQKSRIFVYALDGADPHYISRFLDKGLLPNLRKLKEEFFSSKLHSVKPTNSAVAWSSFFTGMNPGKHGVFGWRNFNIESGQFTLNNYNSIHGRTIPEILGSNHMTIGLIGFPLMDPKPNIDGFWIPGFTAPYESTPVEELIHPPGIIDELKKNKIEMNLRKPSDRLKQEDFDAFVKEDTATNRNRVRAAVYLFKKYDLECTMILNTCTDDINHQTDGSRYLEEVYVEADKDIDYVMGNLDSDTTFMAISDHGSIRYNRRFYINNLLYKKGFIRLREQVGIPETLDRGIREKIVQKYGRILGAMWRLTPGKLKTKMRIVRFSTANIDFENSIAYNPERGGQIYLNKNLGNRREDVVNALRESDIVSNIYDNEELYKGRYSKNGPDILFDLDEPHSYIVQDFNGEDYYEEGIGGGHRETGIIYTNIEKGGVKSKDAYSLLDVMPTILSILGIPIPDIVDGESILQVEQTYESVDERSYLAPKKKVEYGPKERKEIRDRLKELGYL